jgi:hypothetical protein
MPLHGLLEDFDMLSLLGRFQRVARYSKSVVNKDDAYDLWKRVCDNSIEAVKYLVAEGPPCYIEQPGRLRTLTVRVRP